jgi:hypothetical protein
MRRLVSYARFMFQRIAATLGKSPENMAILVKSSAHEKPAN